MTRIQQKNRKKQILRIVQDNSCPFCDYPLILGCEIHHLIPYEVKGPDHLLNLIGLCPNHHKILESVRQHIAPSKARSDLEWEQRAQAAMKMIESFSVAQRQLFDNLSEPYSLKEVIRKGVKPEYREELAIDTVQSDIKLLIEAHRANPKILLLLRIEEGKTSQPYTEIEWEKAVNEVKETICALDFHEVITQHLSALELPFNSSWLEQLEL